MLYSHVYILSFDVLIVSSLFSAPGGVFLTLFLPLDIEFFVVLPTEFGGVQDHRVYSDRPLALENKVLHQV